MTDIDTRLLRSFLTVAAGRSFSIAAELLGCSQGTMSLRIRTLEEQVGMRLLERNRADVRLTDAGRDLLPGAQAMVDLHDRLIERAGSKLIAGTARLGVAEDCCSSLLPGLIGRMRGTYSALEIEIRCGSSAVLRRDVGTGSLDLAVVMMLEDLPSAAKLSRPRLYWVAAPEFAVADWPVVPIAGHPEGYPLREAAVAALESRNTAFREVLTGADEQAIRCAVACGAAVAVMAEGTIPADMKVISHSPALASPGRAVIQLLETPEPLSEAAGIVKREIASLYPGA
ncbi:MAG: LysR family transcriptional regulator [Gammaproteobacteria bacterium]|nr:LysR family transcriptional regulator [Gammaproteobacteria bacterium]